jgi:hypothetical protein
MIADTSAPPGPRPPVLRSRPLWWWGVTALAVIAALFVGGTVQHAVDDRSAARDLYRTQVLTTFSRILDEEHQQLALPPAQRSAAAFGDLLDSIKQDSGVNGQGTLQVSMDSGSVAPVHQAAFAVTVSSPYASTTVVVWSVIYPGSSDDGACVLTSTLLGSGRASSYLDLGGNEDVAPCLSSLWRGGPITPSHPNLSLGGIDQSGA